jgi:uncharacterized protein Smg (DUF494 family)
MAKIKFSLDPILATNAIYLGTAPVFIYNKDETKTLDANSLYIKFACEMLQQFGSSKEVVSAQKMFETINSDSNESSLQPKISLQLFNELKLNNLKTGCKGILKFTAGAVEGKFYPKFYEFIAKDNGSIPPPPTTTKTSVSV